MSSRLTSEEIKAKFTAIALLEEQIATIKGQIKEFYSLNENVNNETYLTENHHRWSEPSDDSRDILFARLEESKAKLTEFYAKEIPTIKNKLDLVIFELNQVKKDL